MFIDANKMQFKSMLLFRGVPLSRIKPDMRAAGCLPYNGLQKSFELCGWICAYDKDTKPRTKPRHSARSRRIQEVNECLREHMYTY